VLRPQPVLVEREPRVALGQLEDPALVAALGVADLDRAAAAVGERLGEHPGVLHRALDDHERRDRRRGRVVLEHELLGHLGLVALGLVVEVEALAVGQDAVADLEDLSVRVGLLGRDRDRVQRADGLVRDPLPLQQAVHGLQPVAQGRGGLEFLRGRGAFHIPLQVALDLAVAAGEEVDDLLDPLAVLLLRHVADTGRPAALDVVVEARAARCTPWLGAVAAAVLEHLAEQVERLPDFLRIRVRAEVRAVAPVLLAREIDARELLVQ
jgi:hypothetical protein